MSAEAPEGLPDLGQFRYWNPDKQQEALDLLRQREASPYRPFYCANPRCEGKPHDDWTFNHARSDQRPPKWSDSWLTWLLSGGRGSGKTRTGSEVTHRISEKVPRIILIAPTGPDLRETMVEGVSGILATSPPGKMPEWEPSKKKLTWPNGCIAQGFSAEEPDRLRGPQSAFVWADEPAHYDAIDEVWDNMLFGLRIGENPKVVCTSTPKPTKWLRELLKDPATRVRRVSSYANLDNLSPVYRERVLKRYEGTRLGKQELHGEMLEDVEGALWNWEMLHHIEEVPVDLVRIVVSVDPAGTANRRSDETGIIVLGIGTDKNIYVLEDLTGRYSPEGWASKVDRAMVDWKADAIVVEETYGKDLLKHVLRSTGLDDKYRIIPVDSRKGKQIRAEPIVALYEKKRVFHVGKREDLAPLEDEQTSWIPGESPSPNRVDALVHGTTDLAKRAMPTEIVSPADLFKDLAVPTSRSLTASHIGGRHLWTP